MHIFQVSDSRFHQFGKGFIRVLCQLLIDECVAGSRQDEVAVYLLLLHELLDRVNLRRLEPSNTHCGASTVLFNIPRKAEKHIRLHMAA